MEKFNQIMKQKRLQHSQGNPVHLKRKDSHMPMLKIKQDLSKEVPEYLKELAESGIEISQFLEQGITKLDEGQQDASGGVTNHKIKAVKNTIKRM